MRLSDFYRLIAPVQRKIMMLVGRGELKRVNNAGTVGLKARSGSHPQRIQAEFMSSEILTDMERFQEYGLETYPKTTAEALAAFLNGNRENACVVVIQDKTLRPTDLSEGEVCLYDGDGARVWFQSGKMAIGNKTSGRELLDMFDRLIDEFDKLLDFAKDTITFSNGGGPTGPPSNSALITPIINATATIKSELAEIKGSI
jgi:hypothetical protein